MPVDAEHGKHFMPDGESLFVLLVAALITAAAFSIWTRSFAALAVAPPSPSGRMISCLFIGYFLTWKILLYQGRGDLTALASDGPSSSNMLEAALIGAAALWATFLIATCRVRPAALISGPGFWITTAASLFAATSFWSLWVDLTVLRAVELAAFWIIALHAFTAERWIGELQGYLAVATASAWLDGLLHENRFGEGIVFGAIYRNDTSLIAAAMLLLAVFRTVLGRSRFGFGEIIFAAISLVVFGSMSSVVGAAVGLLILAVPTAAQRLSVPSQFLLCVLTLFVAGLCFALFTLADPDWLVATSSAFGKNTDNIETLTGRMPLWAALWDIAKDNPFGFGFAAADRLIFVIVPDRGEIGWDAAHSHNGFLSAYLSAGWFGFFAITGLVAAVLWQASKQDQRDRAAAFGLIALMVVNNMSFIGFGSYFNSSWVVMMVLAYPRARIRARLRHAASPIRPVAASTAPAFSGHTSVPTQRTARR